MDITIENSYRSRGGEITETVIIKKYDETVLILPLDELENFIEALNGALPEREQGNDHIQVVNACAKKLQVAETALANIIKCEQGHEDFKYEDTIEIASRAQEQIMKYDGF